MAKLKNPIRRILKEKGWTQQQLAQALGVVQPGISDVMNGKRRFGPQVARRLVKLSGGSVTLEEVLFGQSPRRRRKAA